MSEGSALAAFAIGVPVIAFVVSVGLRVVADWRQRQARTKPAKPEKKGRRLLTSVIGGILIPVLVSSVVSWARVSGHSTLFTIVLGAMKAREEDTFVASIGSAIVSAESYETKVQGVYTLAAVRTSASLDELFRVIEQDPVALSDGRFYSSMSEALAFYGSDSRDRLILMLRNRDDMNSSASIWPAPGLHRKYFEGSFDELRSDVERAALDAADREAQLLRIDEAEVQIRVAMQEIESAQSLVERGDPILDFVLDTFLLMEEIEDYREIYILSKTIAADPTHLPGTRSRAILLVGKLGSEADLNVLVQYLRNEDESTRATALRAIRNLHQRLRNSGEEPQSGAP